MKLYTKTYSKTAKGARALASRSRELPANALKILANIDGNTDAAAIMSRLGMQPEEKFFEFFVQLETDGYIRAKDTLDTEWANSTFDYRNAMEVKELSVEDFLEIVSEAAPTTSQAADHAREAEETRLKAEAEARAKAEENARREAEAKAEAERKAREAEAARLKAEAEARARAEEAARREAERIAREEAERKAREAEKARLEAERRAREEAEARARAEAEEKAKREAEAKTEAERKAREAEEARLKAEAEARARAEEEARREAERKAREEAEARARAEAEAKAAQLKAEEEARARAEEAARREADRIAREEAARKVREAEEQAKREAEATAEAERKAREAEEARLKAEAEARAKAEEEARREAERRAEEEAEARARAEAEAKAAQLKAEEEARREADRKAQKAEEARLKAEAAARVKAEKKAKREAEAKAKAEAERVAREEAERKAREEEEARRKAEAEEARQRDEAEARARAEEEARLEVERIARDAEAAREKAERRAERKAQLLAMLRNVRLGGWTAVAARILVVYTPLALVVLVALVHFVNLGMLAGPIEKLASDSIGEPVRISEVRVSLLPKPSLTLAGVAIGANGDTRVGSIQVAPLVSTLFDEIKTLKSLALEDMAIDATRLDRQMQWISSSSRAGKLKIARISLKHISFKVPGLDLAPFDGTLGLSPSGNFSRLELSSADRDLTLQFTPQDGDFQVALSANSWQLPVGTKLQFSELSATGLASVSQVRFSRIEGRIYGGSFKAQGTVEWSPQLSASGGFELENVSLPRALSAMGSNASIEGTLNADASFASTAREAARLGEAPDISAAFVVLDGKINGIDLTSPMLGGSRDNATRFDKLTGNLKLKNGHYQYRQLALDTSQLHARGSLDIRPDQVVSGQGSAELAIPSRRMQKNFVLAGKVGEVRLK